VRAEDLKDLVSRQVEDVHDLVDLLEIELEDVLDRFFDRVYDNKNKFGVEDLESGE
jgi:hypothetical protein